MFTQGSAGILQGRCSNFDHLSVSDSFIHLKIATCHMPSSPGGVGKVKLKDQKASFWDFL